MRRREHGTRRAARVLRTFAAAGLHYAWAAPATAIGLLCAAVACGTGARVGWREGVVEVSGGRCWRGLRRSRWPWRFDAITLGHVVLADGDLTLAACRDHERVHVRQYERYGILFFPLYLASSLRARARGGDPYRDNRFEREAFAAERSHAHTRHARS